MAKKNKKMNAKTKAILNTASISVLAVLSLMLVLRQCNCKDKCGNASATKVILLDTLNGAVLPGSVNIINNNSNTLDLNNNVNVKNDVKVDNKIDNKIDNKVSNKVKNNVKTVEKKRPVQNKKPGTKPVAPIKKQEPKVIVDESKKVERDTVISGCPAHVTEKTVAKEVICDGKRVATLEWEDTIVVKLRANRNYKQR